MRFNPRHYHCEWADSDKPSRYQIDDGLQNVVIHVQGEKPLIPESIHRLAWQEYARQHPGQSYERMQERGGLSVLEMLRLLADYVERHSHDMARH